jgi:hypothetical protein
MLINGCVKLDGMVVLTNCCEISGCVVTGGEHAGMVAVKTYADTYYACLNLVTMQFRVEIPDDECPSFCNCSVCATDINCIIIKLEGVNSCPGYHGEYLNGEWILSLEVGGGGEFCKWAWKSYQHVHIGVWLYYSGLWDGYVRIAGHAEIDGCPVTDPGAKQAFWGWYFKIGNCEAKLSGYYSNQGNCSTLRGYGGTAQISLLSEWTLNTFYDTFNNPIRWGGKIYKCRLAHTSNVDSKPGVGKDWRTYWRQIIFC